MKRVQFVRLLGLGLGVLGAVLTLATTCVAADENNKPALGVTLSASSRGGVRVVTVMAHSPAALCGLQPGDQILAVSDEPVASTADVIRLVGQGKINQRTAVAVDRDGLQGTLFPKLLSATEVFAAPMQAIRAVPVTDSQPSPRSDVEDMPYQS